MVDVVELHMLLTLSVGDEEWLCKLRMYLRYHYLVHDFSGRSLCWVVAHIDIYSCFNRLMGHVSYDSLCIVVAHDAGLALAFLLPSKVKFVDEGWL